MLSGDAWEAAGINRKTFLKWAQAISGPRLEDLILIQSLTGVSLDWLATGEGPMRLADRGMLTHEEMQRSAFLRTMASALASTAQTAMAQNAVPTPQAMELLARSLFDLYTGEVLRLVEAEAAASPLPARRKKEA